MATIYPNRKDGKIVSVKFKAFLGRDEHGKQIFKCKTWTPDKPMTENKLLQLAEKESVIWERQITEETEKQKQVFKPKDITFENFVLELWYPQQMSEKDHRTTTIVFHNSLLKIILPYLGKYKLQEITDEHIEKYLDYLKYDYKSQRNKPLSPKTIRHHYSALKFIFNYAEKLDFIIKNPLNKVVAPKLEKHKVNALSKRETLLFIKEIKNLPLMQRTMYTLLLTTGIRRGECFGLQWQDVDFNNKFIRVERNVTYTSKKGVEIGLPKTDTGIRKIPLTDRTITLLTAYKEQENEIAPIKGTMFLFHSAVSPYQAHDPTYLTKHLKKFMKRVNLPDMSPHDLRHTCGSLLVQSGADIKSVQDILGHADASTTLNFYVKSDMETMRATTQKVFDF